MAAFLYKEYVAVRGRWIAGILLTLTLLIGIATACVSDAGWVMALHILVSTLGMCGMLAVSMGLFYQVAGSESTWKQKAWLQALPVSRKTYIAAKYWFVLILFYVVYSCCLFWHSMISVRLLPGELESRVDALYSFLPALMFACIMVAALEFPFALLYGRQKAELVKSGIAVCFGLALVLWFFFGDISVFDRLGELMIYVDRHPAVMMEVNFIFSAAGLAGYYGSYCITVRCYEREVGYGDE